MSYGYTCDYCFGTISAPETVVYQVTALPKLWEKKHFHWECLKKWIMEAV